ncbi:MAG: hypothetical protein A3J74_02230 [Elusimicrobia bacterium RIFCSPHIGHO2_02_FULL_57_9]|nr:MAG: hypothetical protein A3J74_02230 [Elusimicrobia bacterium RIFCSPHIGHO2_02_FULL_57_9]
MRLSCPSSYRENDSHAVRLLRILGAQKLSALQRIYGGKRIWIPKRGSRAPCAICRLRNECVDVWRSQGASVAAISRFLRISPKTAYRILQMRNSRLRRK